MATKTKLSDTDLDPTVIRDAARLPSAGEAVGYAEAGGGRAIRIDGMNMVVPDREADRLERLGAASTSWTRSSTRPAAASTGS
jgi:hypothetical protein